jgi:hypothetical protein
MIESLDTGALLSRTYQLPAGPRVRLRYARRSDLPGLRALLEQRGIEPTELELARLVRYDPRRRAVICATAPIGGTELIVGVGAIELEEKAPPETLVVDESLTDGLADLLAAALVGRARAHARRVA